MSPGEYILLSAAATGLVLALGVVMWKPPRKQSEPPREMTRWKRFKITPAILHGPLAQPGPAVVEEPGGLRLVAAPRAAGRSRGVRVAASDGKARIDISPRWRLFHRELKVGGAGKGALTISVPRKGPKKLSMAFDSPADECQLAGNPGSREYQILKGGRLVANVSWQRPAKDEGPRKEYVLETVKTEDPLPLVALALAVEVALGQG